MQEKRRRRCRNQQRANLGRQLPTMANCKSPIAARMLNALRVGLPTELLLRVNVPISGHRADFLVSKRDLRLVVQIAVRDEARHAALTSRGCLVAWFAPEQVAEDSTGCAVAVAAMARSAPTVSQRPAKKAAQRRKEKRARRRQRLYDGISQENRIALTKCRTGPLEPTAPAPPRTSVALW